MSNPAKKTDRDLNRSVSECFLNLKEQSNFCKRILIIIGDSNISLTRTEDITLVFVVILGSGHDSCIAGN